jgi:methionyl-tRNA formyltransferase
MKIVFFGTPDFAVASLLQLVDSGFDVAAVVTSPDKPAGRGLQTKSSPVKEAALSKGIPVLQPEKLKSEVFLSDLKGMMKNTITSELGNLVNGENRDFVNISLEVI